MDVSRLKPLVWRREVNRETADVPFGFSYRVVTVWTNVFWQYGIEPMQPCTSIDHGKELCQADYRRRVAALFEG